MKFSEVTMQAVADFLRLPEGSYSFDEDGKMLVSMDIAARVIVDEVPKSGDASLPLNVVWMAMGVAAMLLIVSRRRAAA